MTPTRLLIGQAVVVITTITGTLWVSTQWTAYRLRGDIVATQSQKEKIA